MTGPSLGILKVPLGRISRKKMLVTTRQKAIIASYASAFESIVAQPEKADVVGGRGIFGEWGIANPRQTGRTELACADSISPSELVQCPTCSGNQTETAKLLAFWDVGWLLCLHLDLHLVPPTYSTC